MTSASPRKWKLKLLMLLALAGGGAYFWLQNSSDATTTQFTTATVDYGDLEQTTLATGKLEPVLNVEVGSQVSGNLAEILVDFNAEVTKG